MRLYKPGTELYSETVSSPLEPRAFWKMEVDPNGWREEQRNGSHSSIFFHLTGPMVGAHDVSGVPIHSPISL